uniref:Uncharacterized protein n=1 Tax=Anopheles atroparvus TaxID=41427 RepID=A0A182JFH3_ANOAO
MVPGTPGLLGRRPDGPGTPSMSAASASAERFGCRCAAWDTGPLGRVADSLAASIDGGNPPPPPAPSGVPAAAAAAGLCNRWLPRAGTSRARGPQPPPVVAPPAPPTPPPPAPPATTLSREMTGLTLSGWRRGCGWAVAELPACGPSSSSVGELSRALARAASPLSTGRAFQPPPFRGLIPPTGPRAGWLWLLPLLFDWLLLVSGPPPAFDRLTAAGLRWAWPGVAAGVARFAGDELEIDDGSLGFTSNSTALSLTLLTGLLHAGPNEVSPPRAPVSGAGPPVLVPPVISADVDAHGEDVSFGGVLVWARSCSFALRTVASASPDIVGLDWTIGYTTENRPLLTLKTQEVCQSQRVPPDSNRAREAVFDTSLLPDDTSL